MADQGAPTTGNPVVDEIIREGFTEAIGLLRQVIMDLAPQTAPEVADRIAAIGCTQVWRPLAKVVTEGMQTAWEAEQ